MVKKLSKMLHVLFYAILIVQLSGCGTIMYPERKGQKAGRIDAGVAVMDGLCLLLFIIPGVIAYAVDFNNGTIYLPGTHRSSLDIKNLKQVQFDPKYYTYAAIEKIIEEETGCMVKLNQNKVKVSRLKSTDEMMMRFAEILPEIKNNHIVLSMK
ncbi:MAG: hypothetical protein K9L86_06970 [Candidatus Omnitrophica bacterium]|nr:hypothetical protein [Candidatus Omnitrophota bacterium]